MHSTEYNYPSLPVADPDLELRGGGVGGGGGLDFIALLTLFPSVISFFFTQIKGDPGPPGPSPRSATGYQKNQH